jgi:iron complex transport system ATP-binding protein
MLEAISLGYRVEGRAILDDFSARFAPGGLHLLVGPNGAGKSTAVRLLSGGLRPTSGTLLYEGSSAAATPASLLARRRAVLSQAVEVAFPLTVREVVAMGRYPHFVGRPGVADDRICDEVMAYFEVDALGERSYATLSGGERQRVNFARVLAQVWLPTPGSCRYLFLDEPLTFLDIAHQLDFMRKVKNFAGQSDVVTVGVLHDLGLAARFADRLLVLHQGALVACGAGGDVLDAELVRRVFAVEPLFLSAPGREGAHLAFE